jgi:hypothetical protein
MKDYERLTVKGAKLNKKQFIGINYGGGVSYEFNEEALDNSVKVFNRIAELEDKIEQGTLIELPCKVGDTVYIATPLWDMKKVVKAKVACLEYTVDESRSDIRVYLDHEYVFSKTNPNLIANRYIFRPDEFFLTREEAERKLKELQE